MVREKLRNIEKFITIHKVIKKLVSSILIFIFVLNGMAGILGNMQVRAAGSNLKVPDVQFVSIEDGTPNWDADNNPGNDNGPSNGIVRSYDNIVYTIAFSVDKEDAGLQADAIGNAVITAKVEVVDSVGAPLVNTANYVNATWDSSTLDSQFVTFENNYADLTYTMSVQTGSAYTVPLKLNVRGAPNGAKVRAVIIVKEQNSVTPAVSKTTDWTTVSAKPAMNVVIGGTTAYTNPPEGTLSEQKGRVVEKSLGVYLNNTKVGATDIKGIEAIKGDIEFDLQLDYKIASEATSRPDAGGAYFYDKGLNGSAANVKGILNSAFANSSYPIGKLGTATNSCTDSGTIQVTGSGDLLHVKLSGYKIGNVFPTKNMAGGAIAANQGWIIADAVRFFVPIYDTGSSINFSTSIKNLTYTTYSGETSSAQTNTADDGHSVVVPEVVTPGSGRYI